MPYVYVDIEDIDTDDMISELESRGYVVQDDKDSSDDEYFNEFKGIVNNIRQGNIVISGTHKHELLALIHDKAGLIDLNT